MEQWPEQEDDDLGVANIYAGQLFIFHFGSYIEANTLGNCDKPSATYRSSNHVYEIRRFCPSWSSCLANPTQSQFYCTANGLVTKYSYSKSILILYWCIFMPCKPKGLCDRTPKSLTQHKLFSLS